MKNRLTTLLLISTSLVWIGLAKAQFGYLAWTPFGSEQNSTLGKTLGYPAYLSAARFDDAKEVLPTLLIKSKDYFVHDLNGRLSKQPRPNSYNRNPITYTSRSTGRMHILYESGTFSRGDAAQTSQTRRILGMASDNKNIYLCVWHGGDRRATQDSLDLAMGNIGVIVFRATDGQFIQSVPVFPDAYVSRVTNEDNLGAGPLQLEKNALICFDQTFKFDKGKLIAPKTLPTPAPATSLGQLGGIEGGFGF